MAALTLTYKLQLSAPEHSRVMILKFHLSIVICWLWYASWGVFTLTSLGSDINILPSLILVNSMPRRRVPRKPSLLKVLKRRFGSQWASK